MTLSVSACLEMQADNASGGVTSVNLLGEPIVLGDFDSGEIIGDEFRKFMRANFREPVGNESPRAKLMVKVLRTTVRQPMCSDTVEASLRVLVRLTDADGSKVAYFRDFSATASGVWEVERKVPPPFYVALGKLMTDFVKDWNASRAPETVSGWVHVGHNERKPPALASSVEWMHNPRENIFYGKCEVACNDYEGFAAKTWAAAQILVECRRKLGGIEAERVRVVYDADGEKYDPKKNRWTLRFHAFARTEKVLSFNELTGHGFATGDLELMGLPIDLASKKLQEFAISEMDSRAGTVRSGVPTEGRAHVRFDDFMIDKTYNLLTIGFRLVY